MGPSAQSGIVLGRKGPTVTTVAKDYNSRLPSLVTFNFLAAPHAWPSIYTVAFIGMVRIVCIGARDPYPPNMQTAVGTVACENLRV